MTGSINWRLVRFDHLHHSPTQQEHDDRISLDLRSIMTVGMVKSWDVSHLLPFIHRSIDRTMNGGGEQVGFNQSGTRAPTPQSLTSNAIYLFQPTWAAGEGANHTAQTVRRPSSLKDSPSDRVAPFVLCHVPGPPDRWDWLWGLTPLAPTVSCHRSWRQSMHEKYRDPTTKSKLRVTISIVAARFSMT